MTQVYHYGTSMDEATGEITFGKAAGAFQPVVTIDHVTLPSELPSGWDVPDSIQQPPTPAVEENQKLSAGVVAVVPQGTSVMAKGSSFALSHPCLVMIHPYAEFAGYKLTFPKGRVDKGESIEKAAVREAFEETGLAVRLKRYLGDFKGKTTMTRFFAATVIGGNPKKAGKEVDAVTLKPLIGWEKWNGADAEKYIKSLPWSHLLLKRDIELLTVVLPNFKTEGLPEYQQVDAAEFDHQPATGADITKTVAYDELLNVDAPASGLANQVVLKIDYVPTPNAVAGLAGLYAIVQKMSWGWIKAAGLINLGYPPPGVWVKVKVGATPSTPLFVGGYITTTQKDGMMKRFSVLLGDPAYPMVTLIDVKGTEADAEIYLPVQAVEAPKTALVAGPQVSDFWDSFFKALPFPVTTQMVDVVKSACERKGFVPSSVMATKSKVGGPPYATGFAYEKTSYLAMGHITLTSATGTDLPLQLALDGGSSTYEALPGSSVELEKMEPETGVTDAFHVEDPWFTHPDPKVNATIAKLYANGGNVGVLGLTMKVVKEQWFKEAGLPNYAVVSQNILQDVCALFVPGAASQPLHAAVLACLKQRMKLTQKGKNKGSNDIVSSPGAPAPSVSPNKVQVQSTSWKSPSVAQILSDTAAYDWGTPAAGFSGGSKPNFILKAAGMQWVFKPQPESDATPFRPYTDKAASDLLLLVKPNNTVPVGLLKHGGKVGSVQPVVGHSAALSPADYDGLSAEDKAEILAQHAADMWIGDHDGHFGNWLRTPGGLVSIDKGQAFKFMLKGIAPSLQPTWNPPGNFGTHLAKKLLIDWANGAVEIPASAWSAMLSVIKAVEGVSDDKMEKIVSDMANGAGYLYEHHIKITSALHNSKESYLKDWTAVLVGLAKLRGEVFKWPSAAPAALNIPDAIKQPVKAIPIGLGQASKALDFGKTEVETIAQAAAAGWQGKSLRIDGPFLENQEVMVKRVKYSSAESTEQYATLIHFRMSRTGALKAENALNKKAKVVASSSVGPEPLSIDEFWLVLQAGVITVNSHMGPDGKNKDGKPNPATIEKVKGVVPKLQQIMAATGNPKGDYQGVSNTAANAMASTYLQYADTIIKTAAQAPKLLDQKVEMFYQFLWQEPVKKEEEFAVSDVQVVKTVKAGFWPTSSPVQKEVAIKGTDQPMFEPMKGYGQYKHSQFCVKVPSIPGARLYFNPAKSESPGYEAKTHFG